MPILLRLDHDATQLRRIAPEGQRKNSRRKRPSLQPALARMP
jgi:hypothetical protein